MINIESNQNESQEHKMILQISQKSQNQSQKSSFKDQSSCSGSVQRNKSQNYKDKTNNYQIQIDQLYQQKDEDIPQSQKSIEIDKSSSKSSSSSQGKSESSSIKSSSSSDKIFLEKEQRHGKRLANPSKKLSYLSRQNGRDIDFTIDVEKKSESKSNQLSENKSQDEPNELSGKKSKDEPNEQSGKISKDESTEDPKQKEQEVTLQNTKIAQESTILSKTIDNYTNLVHQYQNHNNINQFKTQDYTKNIRCNSQKCQRYSIKSFRLNVSNQIKKYDKHIFKNAQNDKFNLAYNDKQIKNDIKLSKFDSLNLMNSIKKRGTFCDQIFETEEDFKPKLKPKYTEKIQFQNKSRLQNLQTLYGQTMKKSQKQIKNEKKDKTQYLNYTPIEFSQNAIEVSSDQKQNISSNKDYLSIVDGQKSKELFEYYQQSSQIKNGQSIRKNSQISNYKFVDLKNVHRQRLMKSFLTKDLKEISNSIEKKSKQERQQQISQIYLQSPSFKINHSKNRKLNSVQLNLNNNEKNQQILKKN